MAVAVALDPAAFAIGEHVPREAHAPVSVEKLAALLRRCNEDGDAVVFFGGGTLQGIGSLPERYDVAIVLGKLKRTLEYEVHDLTIALEAGMTAASLETALAKNRQFVPLDAPRAARSTVGGILASGWSGPRRLAYGRPRDLVIGTTVVLADGTVVKSGGMVVKNVSGYDMSKLYIGSLGTLAAIVRANFKTLPLPETRRIAIAPLPESTAARAVAHLNALEIEPTAALVFNGFSTDVPGRDGVDGRLVLLFEGSPAVVDRATRELRSALGSAGVPETTIVDRGAMETFARVLDAYVAVLGERSTTYRSGGTPADVRLRLETFARLAKGQHIDLETIADVRTGDGIVRASVPEGSEPDMALAALDEAAHAALGRLQILAAPKHIRPFLDAWGAPPAALEKMRALKAHFDPKRTLAPGRFVGGL